MKKKKKEKEKEKRIAVHICKCMYADYHQLRMNLII